MRQVLRTWIADADIRQSLDHYNLQAEIAGLNYQEGRDFDFYLALLGELFDLLRDPPADTQDWATLGNALTQLAAGLSGSTRADATFFAATAFYNGGFSASAYVAMRNVRGEDLPDDVYRACHDFLARPPQVGSARVRRLLSALRSGDSTGLAQASDAASIAATAALDVDPDTWIAARVYASLLDRFSRTNVRAVLPDGSSERWSPLIGSLLNRPRPVWDFFPSQIAAIEAGLLTDAGSFSMQMPTGAGKTALTETLLFHHLVDRPGELAVLLVPYRSLARELRGSVARRLSRIGLPTRTVYGGTVPTFEETQGLDDFRAIIATPEALTGLLGNAPELIARISLVVCDEGHLLDQPGRGVGLELLLSRLLGREEGRLRTVFVSAIVPNIEEINAWLGGTERSVVRSDFRPAEAEYAVLRPNGRGRRTSVGLEMQAVDSSLQAYTLPGFLQESDFRFVNATTRRANTYSFESVKTQAIAAARKSLALGTVAVFSATKTGAQGVVGLADELLNQLGTDLNLPRPLDEVPNLSAIAMVGEHLEREYGAEWIGTRALRAGVVVHHGDIPQETREALEELLAGGLVRMVVCTSTLAEGVNLPIRTLVLYAVQRRSRTGAPIPMLARDIRNLVGRAGRAGSSTKGLVIVANPNQWPAVRPVATGQPGEDVHGALRQLVERLQAAIVGGTRLSSELLEGAADLFPLTDGVDSTLLELLHDDVGDEAFQEIAATLAAHTFAARQLGPAAKELLESVFTMRAARLSALRATGRLGWIRETGARARLIDSVITRLAPLIDDWESVETPLDAALIDAFLSWAYRQPDFARDLRDAFPDGESVPPTNLPDPASLREIIMRWMRGDSFSEIAVGTGRPVDVILRIYSSVISYSFATLVEQSVALLQRYLANDDIVIAEAVTLLPQYLRFGVPTPGARALMVTGVRHRRAAVLLGQDPAMTAVDAVLQEPRDIARGVLAGDDGWEELLGRFVSERTREDLGDAGPSGPGEGPANGDGSDPGGASGPVGGADPWEQSGFKGVDQQDSENEPPPSGAAGASGEAQPGDAVGESFDGWGDSYLEDSAQVVVSAVKSMAGRALDARDAHGIVRALFRRRPGGATANEATSELGDVVFVSVAAASRSLSSVEVNSVYEDEYGLSIDEISIDFKAVLDFGWPSEFAYRVLGALRGRILDDDGEWTTVRLPALLLNCTAQLRREAGAAEITDLSVTNLEE